MAKRDIPEINAGSMADIAFLLLIFFLVTTTMDKDQAYIRNIPKKIEIKDQPPIDVEQRNIFLVKANNRNQLMVRTEVMDNPDDISERVVEFYRTNEQVNDPTNNFPMYSRITMKEIEDNLAQAEADAEATENTPNADQEIIDFKYRVVDEWMNKKRALELYGKKELPEIHPQAHVRIEVQKATEYNLFAKIQSEIEEAVFELRNDASKDIFGESYEIISRRYAMDKDPSDKEKLDLMDILYPDRFIEVTPKK